MQIVVFKKQKNEKTHKYSFVDSKTLKNIPDEIILGKKVIHGNIELTKELAEKLMQEVINDNK